MSRLASAAAGRLKKAGDAGIDPADLTTGKRQNRPARPVAAVPAPLEAPPARASAPVADKAASISASENASVNSAEAARKAAPRKASGKRKPRRRVGRPAGPARVAMTVRILEQTDARLTAAVDDTGLNPQAIADEALDRWLTEKGY